eukprot:14502728-Alexandrium_andersonii.AAC.1
MSDGSNASKTAALRRRPTGLHFSFRPFQAVLDSGLQQFSRGSEMPPAFQIGVSGAPCCIQAQ